MPSLRVLFVAPVLLIATGCSPVAWAAAESVESTGCPSHRITILNLEQDGREADWVAVCQDLEWRCRHAREGSGGLMHAMATTSCHRIP